MRSIAAPSRMVNRFWLGLLFLAAPASAQLFPIGTPLPKTLLPPVVFLNGYEASCGSTDFSDTFGNFDQFLQASGRVSVFFDNCMFSGKPSIESLGNSFATFLGSLQYSDGTYVTQVDVVAHSMGGLIVRAYLAGMVADGTYSNFNPPANPGIRKAVFLSSPNFGTYAASLLGTDVQTQELSLGSAFNFALATWNQGTDDLRNIDALAVAGNGGALTTNGIVDGDGVSSLTSSSIGFAEPNKTRILPYCHISYAALAVLLQPIALLFPPSSVCPVGAPGIAQAVNATDSNVLIVESFLNGTTDWQSIGQAPAQNPLASAYSGVILRTKSAADVYVNPIDAAAGKSNLDIPSLNTAAYNEFVPAGATTMVADISNNSQLQLPATLTAGSTAAFLLKPGPSIAAVIPAAALVTPRSIAPGTFVSVYGSNLANATAQAASAPFPTVLGGTEVLVNGTAIPLQYVSPTQVNAVFPVLVSGLVTVTVRATAGQNTVNVLTQSAVPAIFTSNGTAAAAINAVTGAAVTAASPLDGGDFVSLFVTGLGATGLGADGLQHALIQPAVTVAGQTCTLQFAGLSPQFPGVDQINCQVPTGLGTNAAAPVIVTSNGRASNTATLVLQ
jgi:uncharacterized protein (TIGR03437 family)